VWRGWSSGGSFFEKVQSIAGLAAQEADAAGASENCSFETRSLKEVKICNRF
jgi:hypothetical protein